MDSTALQSRAVRMAAASDTGRVRAANEDRVHVDPVHALAVLADGMGGLERGDLAAAETVAHTVAGLHAQPSRTTADVRRAVELANTKVLALSSHASHSGQMGSTVAVWLLVDSAHCALGFVGDSRIYRYRARALEQLSVDHTLVQQMVERGFLSPGEARRATNRHVITRAVGLEPGIVVDTRLTDWCDGDVFLLCSDGLSDMLDDAAIAACLHDTQDLDAAAARLVAAANAAGGLDNISVVLVRP